MISNSDLFYKKALSFQDKRVEIKENYNKALKSIERYKGSPAFKQESEKIEKQYSDSLVALKQEYSQSFNTIFDAMQNEIGKRPAKSPSSEQLNLLNLLRMKKKPTRSDFEMTANACIDCPLALSIITELAKANGVYQNYTRMNPEIDNTYAERIVDGLREGVKDFVEFDSSRASRVAQRYYSINQGIETELSPRRTFSDKAGCFSEIGGLSEEVTAQFCKVVDGND